MASQESTVQHIVSQIQDAGVIEFRKMFGEFTIYCDTKIVAFVADDRFLLKPTEFGLAMTEGFDHEPPYPGAKPCILIPSAKWDDSAWLTELIEGSAKDLPLPKPKTPKKSK